MRILFYPMSLVYFVLTIFLYPYIVAHIDRYPNPFGYMEDYYESATRGVFCIHPIDNRHLHYIQLICKKKYKKMQKNKKTCFLSDRFARFFALYMEGYIFRCYRLQVLSDNE